ncbi:MULTISPECIES: epoxide hydrolase family protein [Enterobacterales]|nr:MULTISPECIES: epoxide hydrolase family protein [Pantoea]HBR1600240.1 epoxide hydrolase [Klebsiella quasipneumoniae subsp. quasipneumoniae]HBS6283501.1 epoxide hydrolase [Klebsiella pneumoniae]MCU7368945.1 epoxide hydrolase [Pantoea stewartii]MDF7784680.1 epoxide hydrolase [Pantoea stewartii]PXV78526.1 microsomal epoxide hydrolase [Pantoea sp. PNA 03-3]
MKAERFVIDIPQSQLDDLDRRLTETRWPRTSNDDSWGKGVPSQFLKPLIEYWHDRFNWREQEASLNQLPHFCAEIEGHRIHFIHVRGKGKSAIPLIMTHGWPDSFTRYTKLIPFLTDPARYGGLESDTFDVIIPSVPGFVFSQTHSGQSLNNAEVARLWFRLMTEVLGYQSFCAAGGDIGSGITRYLASLYPSHIRAIHLTDVGILRELLSLKDTEYMTKEEQLYRSRASAWFAEESAYMALQATRPRTLAYALNDSPAGLAAWITEKYVAWSGGDGDLFSHFSPEDILTNISLYWLTDSTETAAAMYRQNARTLPALTTTSVPVGLCCFPSDILPPPKSWVEKHYNLCHWTEMPRGGHFAAMEEPALYAEDVKLFFRTYRSAIG